MSLNKKIKTLIKIVLLPFLAGVLLSLESINTDVEIEISLCSIFCGFVMQKTGYIGELVKAFSPVILFTILFEGYIYSNLTRSGIYSIIRYKNRIVFVVKMILKLIFCAFFYSAFFVLSVMIFIHPESLSKNYVYINCIAFYNLLMCCFVLALFINLLSFYLGETNGFIVGISTFSLLCIDSLINSTQNLEKFSLAKLSPVRNYIINWHDWEILNGDMVWELCKIEGFSIKFSIIYFLLICLVLVTILIITVLTYDIAVSVKEDK